MSDAVVAADSLTAPRLDLPQVSQTASGRDWRLRPASFEAEAALARTGKVSPALARILAARGVDAAGLDDFLEPTLRRAMPDPSTLTDMDRAVARIVEAIDARQSIWIFGDYDVDGTTASAILKLYLREIGVGAEVYLPDRLLEGYGPSAEAFSEIRRRGADLVVTVDCGAAAHEPVEAAARDGLDVVVIDHHLMQGPPPAGAVATVNPNRADDRSGLDGLSAAGLAFMTVAALNRALRDAGRFEGRDAPDIRALLDLAALGLVCDVMPLTGLTRVFVAQGLKVLAASGFGNEGLKTLARVAGAKAPYGAYELGFLLGPRINAAGRIGHASLALNLLTADDPAARLAAAEKLHELNAARQGIEKAVLEEAIREVETRQLGARPVIVVAGAGWHPGVIGIVAGRLKEKYERPAIVIAIDEAAGEGKGSGRSLTGVDLGRAIAEAREDGLLIGGGGHAMAAGLTIDVRRVDAFSQRMESALAADVRRALSTMKRDIDAVVAPAAVTRRFCDAFAAAGPFGAGNPEPVFALLDMNIVSTRQVGVGHVAAVASTLGGDTVNAIAFRVEGEALGAMLKSGRRLHLAGKIRPDDWRGGEAAQFQIVDAAPAAD